MTTTSVPGAGQVLQGRRRVRRLVPTVGALAAAAATILGVLPALAGIAIAGLLLAGIAGSSQAPSVRTVTASRRTAVAGCGVALGFCVLIAFPALGPRLVEQLPLDTVEVLATVIVAVALCLPAAPLAMSESMPADAHRALTRRDLVLAVTGLTLLVEGHLAGATYLVAAAVAIVPVALALVRLRNAGGGGVRVRRGQAAVETSFWLLLAGTTMIGTFDALAAGAGSATLRWVVVALSLVGVLASLIPGRRVLVATTAVTAAGALFLVGQLASTLHSPTDPITLPAPVRGEWFVVQGGRSELVNAHRAALAQDDALDIVQVSAGATHRGDPDRLDSYYCFGEPVLAPAAGRVASLVADLPDQRIGSVDVLNTAGNNVVIDVGAGRYVAVGHLRAGSVTVAVGDVVRAGQKLGEVGNSGNSDEPHLHLQVQNVPGMDVLTPPDGARTYPWLFTDLTVTRSGHTSQPVAADVRRGDTFTH
jgi:hypothetical protein